MPERDIQDGVVNHARADMARDTTMAQPQGIVAPQREPSVVEALKESKLLGEVSRWVAEGAKDLHNAIIPAFPDSVRGADEPGTPLNPTQYMVTEELQGYDSYDAELDRAAARGRGREQDYGLDM